MANTKIPAELLGLNGGDLVLDADGDTKIDAATDDEIHFTVAGSETVYMGVTSYNSSDRIVLTNTGGNASMAIVGSTSGESSIFMADGTSGDASYRGYVQYQHTNDNMNFGTAGSEAMRIDSSGNVGIGTTSPSRQVHLNNASDHGIMAITGSTSSLAGVVFGDTADDDVSSIIHNNSGNYLYLSTSSTERMRIESGGNVLLNQTATADSGVADARLEITRSSQHCLNCHVAGTGNSTLVAFINDNGFVGGINTNGSATAFNTSSDARLKNVLGDAKGLEVINALNAVNFEWKSDGKIQDGLIAQEVEKVFPDAVSEPELDGEWYSVDYSKLVTPLIKGMQEQQVIIEDLKARIETLEG